LKNRNEFEKKDCKQQLKYKGMTFQKGQSGNPGGRKPGTSNKITGDLRQFFENFIRQNAGAMQKDFNKLSPKDRILFLEKLAKFVIPAMQAVEIKTDLDKLNDQQIDDIFNRIMNQINTGNE